LKIRDIDTSPILCHNATTPATTPDTMKADCRRQCTKQVASIAKEDGIASLYQT
jgi:hypothetical protein